MQLANTTSRTNFTIAFISIFFTFIISLYFQFESFKDEINHVQKDYINIKKKEVKDEVLKVHNQIKQKEKEINNHIKSVLKKRVHLAHTIATSIYNDNKNLKTDEDIKYLIVTALKNISFSNKRAYFFINRNDGKAILFNTKSKLNENTNIWNLKDKSGKFFVQEQSSIALKKNEGFLQTNFVKPDLKDGIQYPKLSYVKMFKPFNWHIGTGEYIDDITKEIQSTILKDIANIRYGAHGYVFVNTIRQEALVSKGVKHKEAKPYKNNKMYLVQLNKSKGEGDFFQTESTKLETKEKFSKITFVKRYEKWGWIIGSGLYIDEVQKHIELRKTEVKKNITSQTISLILVFIFLLLLVYLISKQMSQRLRNNIANLINSFKKASKKNKKIDTKLLTYEEFEDLANSLNKALKSKSQAIEKQENYLDIINTHVITSSTDIQGDITNVSDAFCEISGYSREELIGKSHNIVRHPDVSKEFYEQMWTQLQKGEIWRGEILNLKKNGEEYWVYTIIQPIYKKDKIKGYTAIRHDITDKKKVEYLSVTDELTKLKNRRYFNEVIRKEFLRAKRDDSLLNFMMLDIDYFKKYNDMYGHQAGDEALKEVATALKNATKRAGDYTFRLGGEEFGVLFISKDSNSAKEFAKNILEKIINLKIPHGDSETSEFITVSIGLVSKQANKLKDENELYKLSDEALYKAKEKGRNQVVVKE